MQQPESKVEQQPRKQLCLDTVQEWRGFIHPQQVGSNPSICSDQTCSAEFAGDNLGLLNLFVQLSKKKKNYCEGGAGFSCKQTAAALCEGEEPGKLRQNTRMGWAEPGPGGIPASPCTTRHAALCWAQQKSCLNVIKG